MGNGISVNRGVMMRMTKLLMRAFGIAVQVGQMKTNISVNNQRPWKLLFNCDMRSTYVVPSWDSKDAKIKVGRIC